MIHLIDPNEEYIRGWNDARSGELAQIGYTLAYYEGYDDYKARMKARGEDVQDSH